MTSSCSICHDAAVLYKWCSGLRLCGGAQILLFLLLYADELAGLTPLERRRAKRKMRAEQQKQEELELEQQKAEEALVKPGSTVLLPVWGAHVMTLSVHYPLVEFLESDDLCMACLSWQELLDSYRSDDTSASREAKPIQIDTSLEPGSINRMMASPLLGALEAGTAIIGTLFVSPIASKSVERSQPGLTYVSIFRSCCCRTHRRAQRSQNWGAARDIP